MALKEFLRRQKPLTVSLVSFLLMLAVAITIGLAGGNHIVRYLQIQLMEHGMSHNQEVIEGVIPLLEQPLQDGVPPEKAVASFQRFIEHAEPFGVRLFLIDRTRDRVIADSSAGENLPYPVSSLLGTPARRLDGTPIPDLGQWLGEAWRVTRAGTVELLSLRKVDVGGMDWTVGVSSDLTELLGFMEELHLHLDTVLLITYGLIGLLGFLVLRWVGRRYESGLEEEVAERTRELERLHRTLLDQARLVAIGQTAAVLAHEMRNPLASMKLALSGVRRGAGLSARERERVELVLGEVDRLETLLSETLEYVQPVERDERPVALDELLDLVMELERPLLEQRRIQVQRRRCPACPALRLDSEKMRRALLNLVRNAREATPDGGTVRIALEQEKEGLRLRFHNPGPPLAPEVLARAFDFFFTTKAKGTGLGLGLVKRVVEEHGGRVVLRNEDAGVTVELYLPVE